MGSVRESELNSLSHPSNEEEFVCIAHTRNSLCEYRRRFVDCLEEGFLICWRKRKKEENGEEKKKNRRRGRSMRRREGGRERGEEVEERVE